MSYPTSHVPRLQQDHGMLSPQDVRSIEINKERNGGPRSQCAVNQPDDIYIYIHLSIFTSVHLCLIYTNCIICIKKHR